MGLVLLVLMIVFLVCIVLGVLFMLLTMSDKKDEKVEEEDAPTKKYTQSTIEAMPKIDVHRAVHRKSEIRPNGENIIVSPALMKDFEKTLAQMQEQKARRDAEPKEPAIEPVSVTAEPTEEQRKAAVSEIELVEL
ncbi:hypothetical protein AGMMS49975_07080 [Clostridia bacterium]|nr:hypothetical protein AGMMS49975_07080 [Clostridia bacterium]